MHKLKSIFLLSMNSFSLIFSHEKENNNVKQKTKHDSFSVIFYSWEYENYELLKNDCLSRDIKETLSK